MVITLEGTKVTQDTCFLGFEKNNKVDTIIVNVDTDESWSYKLDVSYPGNELHNVISLNRSGNTCSTIVTSDMLPFHGKYVMQFRGIKSSGEVYHSSMFTVFVKQSIDPSDVYIPVPSEFLQIEENITEINNNPPKPGNDGYWYTWDVNTHSYIKSDIELPSDSVPAVNEGTSGWVLSNDGKNIFWYNMAYKLPVATSTVLGGVLGSTKTEEQTEEVSVDEIGRLYTKPITKVISVDAIPENPDPNVLYLIREEE